MICYDLPIKVEEQIDVQGIDYLTWEHPEPQYVTQHIYYLCVYLQGHHTSYRVMQVPMIQVIRCPPQQQHPSQEAVI